MITSRIGMKVDGGKETHASRLGVLALVHSDDPVGIGVGPSTSLSISTRSERLS